MVNTISKEEIAGFPTAVFPGRIIVIQTEAEAEKAVQYLQKYKVIGFDSETRPSFKKGLSHKISLLQLSTEDTCFLFRLNIIDIPSCLASLLANVSIKKIGLSLKDDFSAIKKRVTLVPEGFVELQTLVKEFGIEDNSLQKIYAILFAEKISKNQRLSNWDLPNLSEAQQKYSALDAWACLRIFNKLVKLNPDLSKS